MRGDPFWDRRLPFARRLASPHFSPSFVARRAQVRCGSRTGTKRNQVDAALARRTLRQLVNEAPFRRANLHPQARFRYRINND